jgi:hypothetical protein
VSNSYSSDFHDIISGNNLYYTATTRYDNATGWGSFNGANLFQTLTNSVSIPISVAPALHISMSNGSLKQGKKGVYQIVVSNGGNGATTGAVALVVNFPSWLSYKSFSGSGWSYNKKTKTFTQSSSLQPGRSYSTLNITVDVQKRAPRSITTTASVSGGGSASATATSTATVR